MVEKMKLVRVQGTLPQLNDFLDACCMDGRFDLEPATRYMSDSLGYAALNEENPYPATRDQIETMAKEAGMELHKEQRHTDPLDEEAMADYLGRIVDRQAFDQKGLIYGMGHAVYSLSDPRAVVFKSFVQQLAMAKGRKADFDFYNTVERLAPQVIAEKRHIYKGVSTNVDFYSGFVYNMLGIPVELYTPMFAVARVVGWSAHRMEELVNVDKIIRPAYKSVMATRDYLPMENRG